MGQNAFVAQIAIRQCPHGEQCALMSTDIGIAGRPSVADIQKFSSGLWSRSITQGLQAEEKREHDNKDI